MASPLFSRNRGPQGQCSVAQGGIYAAGLAPHRSGRRPGYLVAVEVPAADQMSRDRIDRWGDGRDDLLTMTPEGDGANGPAGAPCADLPVRMAGTHSLSGDRRAGISALACLLGHVCAPLRDGVDEAFAAQ